jgi:hypothetical protein
MSILPAIPGVNKIAKGNIKTNILDTVTTRHLIFNGY